MARGEVFPIINCEDLQATKALYRTVFDGRQSYEYVHEGQETYVTLDVGADRPGGRRTVAVEAQQMPWGEGVAYLEDPEGTMVLTIQEPLSA